MTLKGLAMKHTAIQTFVSRLVYYSVHLDHLSTLSCRGCDTPLDIHQPNQDQPHEFLGTCGNCGRWYRIESLDEASGVTVLELPEMSETRQATRAPDRQA
jgi:uncharacterized protein YbaR (Trm112 family)